MKNNNFRQKISLKIDIRKALNAFIPIGRRFAPIARGLGKLAVGYLLITRELVAGRQQYSQNQFRLPDATTHNTAQCRGDFGFDTELTFSWPQQTPHNDTFVGICPPACSSNIREVNCPDERYYYHSHFYPKIPRDKNLTVYCNGENWALSELRFFYYTDPRGKELIARDRKSFSYHPNVLYNTIAFKSPFKLGF